MTDTERRLRGWTLDDIRVAAGRCLLRVASDLAARREHRLATIRHAGREEWVVRRRHTEAIRTNFATLARAARAAAAVGAALEVSTVGSADGLARPVDALLVCAARGVAQRLGANCEQVCLEADLAVRARPARATAAVGAAVLVGAVRDANGLAQAVVARLVRGARPARAAAAVVVALLVGAGRHAHRLGADAVGAHLPVHAVRVVVASDDRTNRETRDAHEPVGARARATAAVVAARRAVASRDADGLAQAVVARLVGSARPARAAAAVRAALEVGALRRADGDTCPVLTRLVRQAVAVLHTGLELDALRVREVAPELSLRPAGCRCERTVCCLLVRQLANDHVDHCLSVDRLEQTLGLVAGLAPVGETFAADAGLTLVAAGGFVEDGDVDALAGIRLARVHRARIAVVAVDGDAVAADPRGAAGLLAVARIPVVALGRRHACARAVAEAQRAHVAVLALVPRRDVVADALAVLAGVVGCAGVAVVAVDGRALALAVEARVVLGAQVAVRAGAPDVRRDAGAVRADVLDADVARRGAGQGRAALRQLLAHALLESCPVHEAHASLGAELGLHHGLPLAPELMGGTEDSAVERLAVERRADERRADHRVRRRALTDRRLDHLIRAEVRAVGLERAADRGGGHAGVALTVSGLPRVALLTLVGVATRHVLPRHNVVAVGVVELREGTRPHGELGQLVRRRGEVVLRHDRGVGRRLGDGRVGVVVGLTRLTPEGEAESQDDRHIAGDLSHSALPQTAHDLLLEMLCALTPLLLPREREGNPGRGKERL